MKNKFQPEAREQLDKIIREKHLTTLMNNRKWVKLISTLVAHAAEIKQCNVKLIWEDEPILRELLFDEDTGYNFDYYETSMEAMISGNPKGWYEYKEIEWLDFPRFIKDSDTTGQNLERIQKLFLELGEFETHLDENNLRLYAYHRQKDKSQSA